MKVKNNGTKVIGFSIGATKYQVLPAAVATIADSYFTQVMAVVATMTDLQVTEINSAEATAITAAISNGAPLNFDTLNELATGKEDTGAAAAALVAHNAAYAHGDIAHTNRAALDGTQESFTTALKSTYDGYAAGKEATGVAASTMSSHTGAYDHGSIAGKLDASKLVYIDTAASVGGTGATESVVCTGLAAGDTVLAVTQMTAGAGATALVAFVPAVGSIGLTWTADPGVGAIARVLVLKA